MTNSNTRSLRLALSANGDIVAMKDFTDTSDDDADDDNDQNQNQGGNPLSAIITSSNNMPMPTDSSSVLDIVIDYNDRFANAEPAMFREGVISQVMGVLIGKDKPNALLVGPAGTGKTKIVEDIARRIVAKDPSVPEQLLDHTIYEMPLSNLVAGASLVGELEERAKAVIEYMEDPKNKCILFIDEIHMILDSRDGIYSKLAQILKPSLARGRLKVIGATTLQESTTLANDPAFSRRFSRVIVDEFTPQQTIEIMKSARAGYAAHYGNKVLLDDEVLETVQSIADKYSAPGLHRPDNALTLLDRSCADAVMDRLGQEAALASDPNMLAMLKSNPMIAVTEKRIRKTAMILMTGHASKDRLDIDTMRAALSPIKGQDKAVEEILRMLQRRDLELFETKQPLAVLMAGSSGVGKTEVSRIIAKELTGNDPIMLNMTEYSDPTTVNRIIGSPDGYVGSDSKKERPFDILQTNPYQVILLDELEKADRAVQRLFMSALEEGKLRMSNGTELDFSHAIVFATTNAGSGEATSRSIGFVPTSDSDAARTANSMSAWFDPEFLNRFQAIVQFSRIGKDVYRDIVANRYAAEAERINRENRKLHLPAQLPEDDLDRIVEKTYVPDFGARPAMRAVRSYIEDAVLSPAPTTTTAVPAAQEEEQEEGTGNAD